MSLEGTMDRQPGDIPADRSAASLEEARELRAAIQEALDTPHRDERLLREAVWTFVGFERDAGVPPGRIIIAITGLVESARTVALADRAPLLRRVILWSVEAFFGHLGGDVFERDRAFVDVAVAR
jgi:hypothetical protein